MSAKPRRGRLRDRLMLAFSAFALLVVLLYGFYVVLFVYLVEDSIFQGLLADEAAVQLAHHAETGAWVTPQLRFVSVHPDPATLPDALGLRLAEAPWRREFPGEAGRHYHLQALEPAGSAAPTWLLAEVSQHLVVRSMRGGILQWLGWSALAVTVLALLFGAWLARRMTAPLSRLAALVDDAEPTLLPARFAEGFPDDEVGTLARGLERLIERVDAFVEREREFTRDASHELRTPLTVIRSACERLGARTDLRGEAQRQLEHVRQSAQQLERTVAALLALAREDVDTSAPDIAVLPVLERVIVDQAPLLEGRDVSIRVEVPHATQARLPAPVLHIVLSNLVGNAFAHGGSGDVVIDVDAGGLRIANPGAWPGETAFQPFVKSEASAGVGLGLAIVRRLCARHRIALRFESEGLATVVHLALGPSGDA
ncbi:HAMP domain-containing sensor histidine kinase [Luteimonas sp. 100069]|uniref:sensor histidine kinase n=1 Tax=Luteimonas sp. 100069 TaxID=2006109 RepID=UPI000F4DD617|nr:HAMP domain-containing sensor histidine kinase [Luteimonas sp. 100069]RPD85472.1 sensor histidine kinase [Luteimonas sp. 100069]